ncbi:hypothetical protein JK358_35730 [Nocardia sp. 2]|uniref:Excreted virulence factor EspC (Type VII ESX diderm) n=1 Tax=Nocardia acididurans TaxID=2802282 RepID=A0ABS1MGU4_9NOCA|nr:type VII secretion target [Nocardia acididurans]MBL1079766.1 hypothetical protein [Nocardia acididurans]
MNDFIDLTPEMLRQWEKQHRDVSEQIRQWAKPPTDWLNSFPDSYGTIADPVHKRLGEYFGVRELMGNRLADEHERTADRLHHAADAFERADEDGARAILNGGADPTTPVSTSGLGIPGGGGPGWAGPGGPGPGPGPGSGPEDRRPDTPQQPVAPGATPISPNNLPAGTPATLPGVPATPLTPAAFRDDERAPSHSQPPTGVSSNTPGAAPALTPFLAAVGAARERAAEPAHVVGDTVNEDLLLARTLLSALLSAVGSTAIGVSWAVSVMRGPGGIAMFVTSNEGRGWLPPEIHLPDTTSTPWNWTELLHSDGGPAATSWEGIADPARILTEFARGWGDRTGAQLSALASSTTITPMLRATHPDVAMAERVTADEGLDLRAATAGTLDRLSLTGSDELLAQVAAVPDAHLRHECLHLATDAHTQWGHARTAADHATRAWRARERILRALENNEPVPQQQWDELRELDTLLATEIMARRADVNGIPVGELRPHSDTILLSLGFERRCNEAVLMLADDTTRQTLRDIVYAHDQVLGHPRFTALAAAVATTPTAPVTPVSGNDGRTITARTDTPAKPNAHT